MERQIRELGALTFLDCEHLEPGDDFEEKIIENAQECSEILVLCTPVASERKYVWMEIGMFLGARKRVIAVLYGGTRDAIYTDHRMPVALKRVLFVELNDVQTYLGKARRTRESMEEPAS